MPSRRDETRHPDPTHRRSRCVDARKRLSLLLCAGAVLMGFGSAHAYRFYASGRIEGRRVADAQDARRWSSEVWDAGDTLVFEVAPDPDFEVFFDSPEGVLPYVERALGAWSEIPTANIRWRVDGVGAQGVEEDAREERSHSRDGRSTIFIKSEDDGCGGTAYSWHRRSSSSAAWFRTQCDAVLCAGFARLPEDLEPEAIPAYRERRREAAVNVLTHEFGHCLGLRHAGALALTGRYRRAPRSDLVHPRDPAMSYGFDQVLPAGLTADDRVGASLLRPVRGWQRTAGSISGSLAVDGVPASYAQVWALPVGPDPLRERIGVFSDDDGEFLIEGLEPGHYALWVQPLYRLGAHRSLLPDSPVLDLDDSVRGSLVRVRAGRTTGDVEIGMRRGRAPRPPPEAFFAAQEPGPGTSITSTWDSPCSGVRMQAARPYPADGPLWFTDRVRSLRGDRWFGTTLEIEWSPDAEDVVFDWAGSYRAWWWDTDEERAKSYEEFYEGLGARVANLDVSIARWEIQGTGSVVRHTLEIAWPESTEASMRFRSADDTCDGEPMVVCDLSGCELRGSSGT